MHIANDLGLAFAVICSSVYFFFCSALGSLFTSKDQEELGLCLSVVLFAPVQRVKALSKDHEEMVWCIALVESS